MIIMPKLTKTQLTAISTKTGDRGESSLADGRRVAKSSLVFSALGDVDELNSWLGLLVCLLDKQFAKPRQTLLKVQEDLFYLGAELAASPTSTLSATAIKKIESESTHLQQLMAKDWTKKFLLPGGSAQAAQLDIARAVCRRAERSVATYGAEGMVSIRIKRYLNRLSDYLYVLRCFVNQELVVTEKKFISTTSK